VYHPRENAEENLLPPMYETKQQLTLADSTLLDSTMIVCDAETEIVEITADIPMTMTDNG